MNKTRRTLVVAMAAALAPGSLVRAQQPAAVGYTTLQSALPLENPGKIEIAEFFWYGCIHCYNLEPALDAWVPKLPPDAYFRRIPAVFNERWAMDASIYYSFEALGLLDKLHRPFFVSHSPSASGLSVFNRSLCIASKKGRCSLSSSPSASKE